MSKCPWSEEKDIDYPTEEVEGDDIHIPKAKELTGEEEERYKEYLGKVNNCYAEHKQCYNRIYDQ